MASYYKFERLDLEKAAIRLIKIMKGSADQPIECTMFQTSLDPGKGIPYEALSYVWGHKEPAHHILVDGCQFTVRKNLFQALTDLRQPEEDRVLWIDAICIDQSHAAERGHQVNQMSRVYSTAKDVIIWLGTSNSEIDQLFYWMRHLDSEMFETRSLHMMPSIEVWTSSWETLLRRFNERVCPGYTLHGLKFILRRPWFSRIWVIQEAALARSATIACGRNSVSSRTFVVMPNLLQIECNSNVQSRLDVMPGPLRSGRNSWWSGPLSQELDGLLQRFGNAEATDPRDVVYALLGLSAHASTSNILRPNYNLSLAETIQHTVLYLLHRSKYLKNIRLADELPLWDVDQLLFAMEDLPQQVYTWAAEHGKCALMNHLISSREDTQNLLLTDNLIRGLPGHLCFPQTQEKIESSVLDLLLLDREVYHLGHISDGVWLFPVTCSMQRGAALGPRILRSRSIPHYGTLTVAIPKQGRSAATVEIILNYPKVNRFTLDGADYSAVARKGTEVLEILSDRSTEIRTWQLDHLPRANRWSCPSWRPMLVPDTPSIGTVLWDNILRDVTNVSCIGLMTGRADSWRAYRYSMLGLMRKRWQHFRMPLGFAAEANNATIATALLDSGADIESRDLRKPYATPLWIAASRGHIELVSLLVSKGANIEVLGGEFGSQCTPLWIAASKGFEGIVSLLADRGAEVNVSAWDWDMVRRTATEIAAANYHWGVLRILAEKGRTRWGGREIA